MGTLYEDIFMFMPLSHKIILRMRNSVDKIYR
jgi:hypothetical protein